MGGAFTARKKKFPNPSELERAWEDYKRFCDEHMIVQLIIEDGRERRIEQSRPLTYTVEGFCVHVKISRQGFYDTYVGSKTYRAVCERIREECEVDARKKFETGQLPGKLAGLWMSKYGYCTKPAVTEQETDIPKFEEL